LLFFFFLIRAIRVIRGSLFLFSSYCFYLSQEISEFSIIHLHPIIQIKADPLVCEVAQFFIKGLEFGLLFDELVPLPLQFLAVGRGGSGVDVACQLFDPGGDLPLQRDYVFSPLAAGWFISEKTP